jgi:hypothetical protein
MNVMQAIERLEELNRKINSINTSIAKLGTYKEFSPEVEVLGEIKDEIIKERNQLEDRLVKTPLVNTR